MLKSKILDSQVAKMLISVAGAGPTFRQETPVTGLGAYGWAILLSGASPSQLLTMFRIRPAYMQGCFDASFSESLGL